jgi:hypothetical protein
MEIYSFENRVFWNSKKPWYANFAIPKIRNKKSTYSFLIIILSIVVELKISVCQFKPDMNYEGRLRVGGMPLEQ